MKTPRAPRLDERRAPEFSAELQERARAWIPEWGLADDGERDFGRALLEIAARFNSEVAERLDGAGEKMRRGFLDWLAVRREAARPARMPVVFKLADTAQESVLATAPVRMQADAAGTPVVFETEKDVRIAPGVLEVVVGVDADIDAFYLPPPGLSDLKPLEPLPTEWRVKSFAAAGETKLQLDPELGLIVGMLIEANGAQYTVLEVDNDLVTINRPLERELTPTVRISKVTTFSPFESAAYNSQEHSLYLGDSELLNIEADAKIEVVGATGLVAGGDWEYWGKVDGNDDEVKWQRLELSSDQKPDAVALQKPKGAIEIREINGRSSRWIRYTTKQLAIPDQIFNVDALRLRINCLNSDPPCPPSDPSTSSPTAEAMANNTPLVLSEPFYPLGREPRQFDAFYLGCKEAFSKKGATAQVCFEMSDATCQAYTFVPRTVEPAIKIFAGVGKDGALHLFKLIAGALTRFRGPLRPPRPKDPLLLQLDQDKSRDLNLRCRPVSWSGTAANPNDYYVAVASGGEMWIWHENAVEQKKSGWLLHSTVPSLPGRPAEVEDIIILNSFPDRPGAVLSNGRFWVFDGVNGIWVQPFQPAPQPPDTPLRDYAALAPIYDANGALTDSLVAVSTTGQLYRLKPTGEESPAAMGVTLDVVLPGSDLPMGIRPVAIEDTQFRVVGVSAGRMELVAVEFSAGAWQAPQRVALRAGANAIGAQVTTAMASGKLQFLVGAKTETGGAFVAVWEPTFASGDTTPLLELIIPDASGSIGGTPLVAGDYIIVPGGRGDAFVSRFNLVNLSFTKVIAEGVILRGPAPFTVNDFISVMPKNAAKRKEWTVAKEPSGRGTDVIYVVDPAFGESVADNPQLIGYRAGDALPGRKGRSKTVFTIDAADPEIVEDAILRIVVNRRSPVFCEVKQVDPVTREVEVKSQTPLPLRSGTLQYWKPVPSAATVVPAIEFNPSGDGNWDASILDSAYLFFPMPLKPSPQKGSAFGVINSHPTVVALAQRWTSTPPPLNAPTPFTIQGVAIAWRHELSDTTSNPALSWEYWNGKGWWSLNILEDGTERLAATGALKFIVPTDIGESDWAGKTNFWIRARLIGGDYGREEVKVITKPGANPNETEQTIERSTENIRAPLVLDLHISYSICNELYPTFVQSEDSGSFRDQSDANRTGGAIVEAFVPLAVMLGRLSQISPSSEQAESRPPECDCQTQQQTAVAQPAVGTSMAPAGSPLGSGRALFIGLDASPSEAPVNVLLLVEKEQNHKVFAPMTIEALIADHFEPIVAEDTTRALGESGLLSMAFAIPPTPRELFGKTLRWLRLKPKSSADGKWVPTLRGAYLNAVWASATETLTRELVGSSDGSPNLTLRVARPPVLRGSLELRVKEPLGEEEREALLKKDAKSVLSAVDGLPGDWVLWKQVIDPNDEPASARVYALDEATGEIRFGDGQRGAIPPIGRDAIVAFSYSRTEADTTGAATAPGNNVAARTSLNLVSPVETVESVTSADQAAGGAAPESDDRVLRFGFARLRHRGRAVTARDIEDLALQNSPDFVQARAVIGPGAIRLVVVVKGKNPTPTAAQARELRRLLLEASPISLSIPNALRIEGPRIRRLRIELKLLVETLDHAGELSTFVKKKLTDYFDTSTGGVDKDGWALGVNPSEEDVAFALIDAPHLEGIVDVKLREISADGKILAWPETLKATEIVLLADDPFRIEFETSEAPV